MAMPDPNMMAQALMGQNQPIAQQAGMLNTPPPSPTSGRPFGWPPSLPGVTNTQPPPQQNLVPVGGITGEGGNPGGIMGALMHEYLNELMKDPKSRQKLIDTSRRQGESIMNAVPHSNQFHMGPQ